IERSFLLFCGQRLSGDKTRVAAGYSLPPCNLIFRMQVVTKIVLPFCGTTRAHLDKCLAHGLYASGKFRRQVRVANGTRGEIVYVERLVAHNLLKWLSSEKRYVVKRSRTFTSCLPSDPVSATRGAYPRIPRRSR